MLKCVKTHYSRIFDVNYFNSKHTMCLLYDICVVLIFATLCFCFDVPAIAVVLIIKTTATSACAMLSKTIQIL